MVSAVIAERLHSLQIVINEAKEQLNGKRCFTFDDSYGALRRAVTAAENFVETAMRKRFVDEEEFGEDYSHLAHRLNFAKSAVNSTNRYVGI